LDGGMPILLCDRGVLMEMLPLQRKTEVGRTAVVCPDHQTMWKRTNAHNQITWAHPHSRRCCSDLKEVVDCCCMHSLTEGCHCHTIVAVWWKIANLREALDGAAIGAMDPDVALAAQLSIVFDVQQLIPAADDGDIRFRLRGSHNSCHTFCVNALAKHLGPSFSDSQNSVMKENMDELAVQQQL
jgi:hypothetical protein